MKDAFTSSQPSRWRRGCLICKWLAKHSGQLLGAAALIALLLQGTAAAEEASPIVKEYRSLLITNPGLVDIAASSESPLEWTAKDREVRFRSAFESGICPRYEGWRTAGATTPEQAFSLRLEFRQPTAIGTVLAYGNAPFQIQAAEASGTAVDLTGDEGMTLRLAAFSSGSRPVKSLTFSAAKVPGQFQNNFGLQRGNDAVDQKLASYEFRLDGVYLFPEALENLAPFATVSVDGVGASKEAEREQIAAEGLNDRSPQRFWRSRKLAESEPAEAVLTWERPVTATVVGCLIPWACYGNMPERAEFSVADAPDESGGQPSWKPLGTISSFNDNSGAGQRLYLFRLPEKRTFAGMKVRFTAKHGHVAVGELLVLGEIQGTRQSEALAGMQEALGKPPIAVPYQLPRTSEKKSLSQERLTLVIEDAQGKRIRNLLADQPVAARKGEIAWDGLDDEGKIVPPGKYLARGLVHEPLRAEYVLSADTPPGSVPWVTKDRRGGWLSDHCGASAVEFLNGKLWIGAPYAEAGDTIIKTDQEGRKEWGLRWLDLDGARHITSANGKIYVGNSGGWRGKNYSVLEVDPETCRFKRVLDLREEAASDKEAAVFNDSLSGLAVSGDRIYLSFRDQNRIDVYGLADGK